MTECEYFHCHISRWSQAVRLLAALLAFLPLMVGSCRREGIPVTDAAPQQKLALTYDEFDSALRVVHYFSGTGKSTFLEGKFGKFTGRVDAVVVSTTNNSWLVQFVLDGVLLPDARLRATNKVECVRSRVTRQTLQGAVKITARFVADKP